ncbi:RluA family pseudouridine synthase [Bacillus sp. T3]|uniref:RluA family pseudouridine synthase n=1 Tax=Bacillus sp. T3 TaxID=467262 RepID=UPI0029816FB4|nr:RluA family pseudouridine synthase [Bacillus sp. T3]
MKFQRKGPWLETIVSQEWNGLTIDQILRDVWNGPKKQIHQLRMEKGILINGDHAIWSKPLCLGDIIQIKFFSDEEFGVIPSYIDIDILFEDDHLLVVNKPSGLDTHPNEPGQSNTLANAVAFYLQSKGEFRKVIHIHRLDKDTTGAVLFAKHGFVGSILDRMLEERKIQRTYLALVSGLIKKKRGTINEPIGRDRHHPTKRRVSPTGQKAVTHYQVLKIFPKTNCSLIQCSLETGRTHQIRVHLSSIGFPLIGDHLYGEKTTLTRQALHAAKLAFVHPFTAEKVECHAPFLDNPAIFPPDSFQLMK